jgi:hypothetical protein
MSMAWADLAGLALAFDTASKDDCSVDGSYGSWKRDFLHLLSLQHAVAVLALRLDEHLHNLTDHISANFELNSDYNLAVTVRAAPGRLSALSVFLLKSILYGAFVWARRALILTAQNGGVPARAGARRRPLAGPRHGHAARVAEGPRGGEPRGRLGVIIYVNL